MAQFVPFHLKDGFSLVDHPSRTPLPAQRALVRALGEVNPNLLEAVTRALEPLDTTERTEVLGHARKAFLQMNLRFVEFLGGLVERRPNPAEIRALTAFLLAAAYLVEVDDLPLLAGFVEGCAPFQVAGFVKPLPPPHTRGPH